MLRSVLSLFRIVNSWKRASQLEFEKKRKVHSQVEFAYLSLGQRAVQSVSAINIQLIDA